MNPTGLPSDNDMFVAGTEEIDEEELKRQEAMKQKDYMDSLAQSPNAEADTQKAQELAEADAKVDAEADKIVAQNAAPLEGVAKWAEENLYIPFADMLDGSKNAEEVAQDRAEKRANRGKKEDIKEVVGQLGPGGGYGVGSEVAKAVVGGRLDAVKETLETADLFGDTVKTWAGIADKEDQVWLADGSNNPDYKRAEFNMSVSDNKTAIGNFVRTGFKIHTAMFGIGKVAKGVGITPPVGTGLGARAGRVGFETVRGGLADLLTIDPSEGTLTQQVAEFFGADEDTPMVGWLVNAMTVDEDSNPWQAKIAGLAEGGVMGASLDSFGEALGAFRRGQKYFKLVDKKNASREARKKLAEESLDKAAKEVADEFMQLKAKVDKDKVAETAARMAEMVDEDGDVPLRWLADPQQSTDAATAAARTNQVRDEIWAMTPEQLGTARRAQDIAYGGAPGRPAMYEIDEKAARLSTTDVSAAYRAQAATDPLVGDLSGRSAPPVLNNGAVDQINGRRAFTDSAEQQLRSVASSAEEADGLSRVLRQVESTIDIDKLARDMRQSTDEIKANTFNAITRFLGNPEQSAEQAMAAFEGLKKVNQETGLETLTESGMIATKTLMSDLGLQVNDLTNNAQDLLRSGRDLPFAQTDMLLGRLQALTKMYKKTTMDWGRFGVTLKMGPIKIGNTPADIAKAMDDIDKFFGDIRGKLEAGDEKSIKDLQAMTQGLAFADGDPLKIMTWGALARKIGWQGALKNFYNSLLSGPITHARNAIGNASVMVLRPTTMALGQALSGDMNAAKASISSMSAIIDAFPEALSAGGKAWKMGAGASGGKFTVKGSDEVATALELLKTNAKTDNEQRVAGFLDLMHNNAILNAPSNALAAGDDFFKMMNARIELKRQVMMESMDQAGNIKFDPQRYEALVNEKIVNGEITDEGLLKLTKEQTFQQDLEGFAADLQNLLEQNPYTKYMVPFVRTPHNLMVYAGTYVPGLNRFLKEAQAIRAGDDEAAKAMLRGRTAMGYGVLATGFGFASQGLLTGNGPADPEMNRIWRQTNEPQSIKIGDKWVSYASIEPLNVMFAAAADLQQIGPFLEEKSFDRIQAQLYWTFTKAFTERSYYKGIQSAVAYLNPGTAGNVNLPREALGFVNSQIPFSGLRRQMTKALTPDMLEYNNELQRAVATAFPGGTMVAKVLGAESKISPFTGKPVAEDKFGNIALHAMNQFLPFNITDAKDDYVLQQLGDYMIDTKTEFGDRVKGMDITPTDSQAINKLVFKGGMNKRLEKIFKSPAFRDSYDEWKAAVDGGQPAPRKDQGWYQMVIREITKSKAAAVNLYSRMDPEETQDFQGRLRIHEIKKRLQKEGRYDELIQFSGQTQ